MVPGTLGHGPLRLSGPWDLVPSGYWDRGILSLSLGPWDLVPSGYWDHGTLSLEAIGTMGHGPLRLSGPWDMVPETVVGS